MRRNVHHSASTATGSGSRIEERVGIKQDNPPPSHKLSSKTLWRRPATASPQPRRDLESQSNIDREHRTNPFGQSALLRLDNEDIPLLSFQDDLEPKRFGVEDDGFLDDELDSIQLSDLKDEEIFSSPSTTQDMVEPDIQAPTEHEIVKGKGKEQRRKRTIKSKEESESEPKFGRGQQRKVASKTVLNGGMTQQDKLERKSRIEEISLREGVLYAQAEVKALKRSDAQRRQRRKAHLLALQPYIERNLRLIEFESEEDRKTVEMQRTWSDARLRLEGVMIQGLEGYWMQGSGGLSFEDELFGSIDTGVGSSKSSFPSSNRTAIFHRPGKAKLGWTKIQKGDQLLLRAEKRKTNRRRPLSDEPVETQTPLEDEGIVGIVRSITEFEIRLTFREPPADLDLLSSPSWRVDMAYNDIIEARLRASVEAVAHDVDATLRAGAELSGTYLIDVLIDRKKTTKGEQSDVTPPAPISEWIQKNRPNIPPPELNQLTESQRKAVELMLNQRISLIQGPPGTGKTSTIVAAIKVLKHHYEIPHPILLTSHTNVAVDNLAQGCKEAGLNVVRAGPTARVRESIMDITLEGKMEKHPSKGALDRTEAQRLATIIELQTAHKSLYFQNSKIKKEGSKNEGDEVADKFFRGHASQIPSAIPYDADSITKLKQKLSRLIQRSYLIRRNIQTDIFAEADVVCCTALSAPLIHAIDFPLVFFDEATMATEPITLATMVKGCQQLSLIGDHKQLSPLIRSKEAQNEGIGESMFERLMEKGELKSVMLDTQHRMHPSLSAFSGQEFYDGRLHDGAKTKVMVPLKSSFVNSTQSQSKDDGFLTFVHHDGRERLAKSKSLENEKEAEIVVSIVADLLAKNEDLHGADIAILTPYAGQRQLIARALLEPSSNLRKLFTRQLELRGGSSAKARVRELAHIEIETIDGFEGREKRAIVFSMVRNNSGRFWGFLTEHKRWNVALTRARNGMWIVGSMAMLERRAPWEDMATIARQAAETLKLTSGMTIDLEKEADEEDGIDDAITRATWKPKTGDHAGFITRFASHLRRNKCVINAADVHFDSI